MRPLPVAALLVTAFFWCPLGHGAADPPAERADWALKSPEEWSEMLDTADAATRRAAVRSLQRTDRGEQAMKLRDPLLRAMARDPDATVRVAAANAVGHHKVVLRADEELEDVSQFLAEQLRGDDAELRKEALLAIKQIGAPAAPALPALRQVVRDGSKEERFLAVTGLAEIGGQGLTDLARLLARKEKEEGDDSTWLAFQMFEHLRERGRPATPALLELAGGTDRRAALYAAASLASVDRRVLAESPLADALLGQCLDALNEPKTLESGLALRALPAFGAKAAPAIPRLMAISLEVFAEKNSPIEKKGWFGFYVGGVIGGMGEAAFPHLVKAMKEGDDDTKALAAGLLGNFTTGNFALPDDALPPLLEMVNSDNPKLWGSAAPTLTLYRGKAREAVPALLRHFVTGKDRPEQIAAAEALKKIDGPALQNTPAAEAMVPALVLELNGQPQPADEAAQLLALIGPKAAKAVPAMLRAALPRAGADENDNDSGMLHRIKEMGVPAIPQLIEALSDPDARVRRASAETLAYMSELPETDGAVPALRRMATEEKDRDMRIRAKVTLDQIERRAGKRPNRTRAPIG